MGKGKKQAPAPVTVTKEVPQQIQEEDRPVSRVNTQVAERAETNPDQSSLLAGQTGTAEDEEMKKKQASSLMGMY